MGWPGGGEVAESNTCQKGGIAARTSAPVYIQATHTTRRTDQIRVRYRTSYRTRPGLSRWRDLPLSGHEHFSFAHQFSLKKKRKFCFVLPSPFFPPLHVPYGTEGFGCRSSRSFSLFASVLCRDYWPINSVDQLQSFLRSIWPYRQVVVKIRKKTDRRGKQK